MTEITDDGHTIIYGGANPDPLSKLIPTTPGVISFQQCCSAQRDGLFSVSGDFTINPGNVDLGETFTVTATDQTPGLMHFWKLVYSDGSKFELPTDSVAFSYQNNSAEDFEVEHLVRRDTSIGLIERKMVQVDTSNGTAGNGGNGSGNTARQAAPGSGSGTLSSQQVSLWPNPAGSYLNVAIDPVQAPAGATTTQKDIGSSADYARLEIVNVLGNSVTRHQQVELSGHTEATLPLSNLPAGVYMLRVVTSEGIGHYRFVKQ